jgi:hypothetical protein
MKSKKKFTNSNEDKSLIIDNVEETTSHAVEKVVQKTDLKLYFNADTQAAIVKFQSSEFSKKEKDKIYIKEILPAFEKLAESLINIHKFTGMHDTHNELKNDCVNFLFETIYKFDAARGTNAFSYFNVVARNWLIIRSKQKYQKIKKMASLDNPEDLSNHELAMLEDYNISPSQDSMLNFNESTENTISMLYEIRSKARSENDLICVNAIITIFESIDDIDLLNKSAVLLYVKELSGLSSKRLTTSIQNIKKHYKKTMSDIRNS